MERVILVGVEKKSNPGTSRSSLEELQELAETAGAQVLEVFAQRLERLDPATLIGPGKVQEVAEAARRWKAKAVLFDEELNSAQQKNLEDRIQVKILDRTRLILDIFARRARTREGRLQVELAQLSYLLPRLTGKWRAYSQQVGGIGTRGPGERQLEYERRHIQFRIGHLKRDIERIRKERQVQRQGRLSVPVPQIAIIGYTNVGKSSLLNLLAQNRSPVYTDDKLFATLDPTTRRVRLPGGGWALFTDTVGFIQKLPHALVAAFRATLEEVSQADCLLLLEDASSPDLKIQKRSVQQVLSELGAGGIACVAVFNKADLSQEDRRKYLLEEYPENLMISVKTGEGIEEMLRRVEQTLGSRWVLREMTVPAGEHSLIQEIYRSAQVLRHSSRNGRIHIRMRVTPENFRRLVLRPQH